LTAEDKLFFAHGPGASGKSTFLEALKAMLGDYAVTADFETFTKKKNDSGVRNDIARLAGARMVLSIEVEEGKRLAEGVVKTLTGGDTISARYLYREFFEFVPRFTLWLAANDRPHVNASDSGMWRRIVQVPFTEAIPEAERDPNVKTTLKSDPAAQSAILTWAVEGCLEWQQNGLQIPERVREYTEEYRAENDPFRDFFDEKCTIDPTARIRRSHLRRAYENWAQANGEYALDARKLADALRQRGITDTSKLDSERAWSGIALINPNDGQETVTSNGFPF
jgi:putative DNA primase/helicase